MMSTLVQELGRLCRYSDVDADGRPTEDIPYALVSKRASLLRTLSPRLASSRHTLTIYAPALLLQNCWLISVPMAQAI